MTGIIDVGGGMRDIYGAGVLDCFLENNQVPPPSRGHNTKVLNLRKDPSVPRRGLISWEDRTVIHSPEM